MKYTLICLLATFNIFVYSLIGLNYEAFSKISHYPTSTPVSKTELDTTISMLQDQLIKQRKHNNSEVSLAVQSEPKQIATKHLESQQKKLKTPNSELHTPNSYLVVPKINLITPLFDTPNMTTEEALEKLEKGVISLKEFIPPYRTGTNLILGHSSDYLWNNNPYSTIFTLIPQLEKGDLIKIISADQTHIYTIQETAITDNALTNLPQVDSKHQLVLSTCWPLGFFNQRFNVIATPSHPEKKELGVRL
ncbi:MAG: sortase [Candidatus Gracilibacteria bacterium]|nr:sortase [Candidatus Gracilibacteria bacterium]